MSKISKTKAVLKGISPNVAVEESELLIGNNKTVTGYHSQEYRPTELTKPIKSFVNTWLGVGFYFWMEMTYAHYWGQDKKCSGTSKSYDVYKARLKIENCLNTVFNEEHYLFFKTMIKEAIMYFKSRKMPVTLEKINNYLTEHVWTKHGIEGIIFDDKPTNPKNKNRIYSEIPDLYYDKRIQIVIFDVKNISNFELYLEDQQ